MILINGVYCIWFFIEFCAELVCVGAMAVRRCKREDLKRIARLTGGQLCSTLANMEGDESFEVGMLGHAEEVVQERISDDELLLIKGTQVELYLSLATN